MKKVNAPILLFAALGLIVLLFFIFYKDDDKRYQWYPSYRAASKEPYGTFFVQKMLESYKPGGAFTVNSSKPLRELLKEKNGPNTAYTFIGHGFHASDDDAMALAKFIDAGGEAFISSESLPDSFFKYLYTPECEVTYLLNYQETDAEVLNFYHDALKTKKGFKYMYRQNTKDQPHSWYFVNDTLFCSATALLVPLGYNRNEKVNFLKISLGRGSVYLHTVPLVFTNYFMTREDKVEYASKAFSHLKGKNLIWDEFSKVPSGTDQGTSPLYYVLQQPSLKYAWWMLLFTVVLYIFFFAKRRQRVIPVLEAKTNTSLEYVNLIAALHYRNGNHLDMARKKMKYFLYFVRSKYGIHAEKFKAEDIRKLAGKSKVDHAEVQIIFDQYYLIEERFYHSIEANRMLSLYEAIENFYKNCK